MTIKQDEVNTNSIPFFSIVQKLENGRKKRKRSRYGDVVPVTF